MTETEIKEQIGRYKNQIIAIIFVILALLISIYVLNILIRIAKYGDRNNEYKDVIKKSQIASLIILITTLYFAYVAYDTYKKSETKANFNFLVAVIFVTIAAFIRFITITNNGDVTGAEDVI